MQAVSAKVGVDLTPDKVAVPGLRYRTAFNFSYDGAPLAEIAYTEAGGAPVLFCVIANGKPDAPPRTVAREGLSYVTWSRGGKSYMFVAHMPEQQSRRSGANPGSPVLNQPGIRRFPRRYPASAVLRTSPPPRGARPLPRGRPVDHP